MNDLVSVIIPLYNRESFIDEALKSVALQSYKTVEVIVVDDGSSDSSAAQARISIEKYNLQGKVVSISNSGPDAARDYAISLSAGSLLAFLDSDDLFLPEYLTETVATLANFINVGWLYSDFYITDADLNIISRKSSQLKLFFDFFENIPGEHLCLASDRLFSYLLREQPIFPSGLIVRRSLYDRVGTFTQNIPHRILSLEWEFMLRSAKVSPVIYLHKPLVLIRKHEGNISGALVKQDEGEISVLKTVLLKYELSCGEKEIVHTEIAERSWHVGYHHYSKNEVQTSRLLFIESLKHKFSLRSALFLLAACLPSSLRRVLRAIKKSGAAE